MKRSSLFILPCLCLLALISLQCKHFQKQMSSGDDRASDEAAVSKADSAWSAAASAKQINDFMKLVTDDGIIEPPNSPTAKGKEAVKNLMNGFFGLPGFAVKWQSTKIEVARSGELAYSMGTYELNLNGPQGKAITDHGKYTTIWKKQDGNWKVAVDIFNSDLPVAPATQQ